MKAATLAALIKGDLRNAVIAATPGGIEAQEKAGQIEQSFASTLPKKLDRAQFEKAGFIFANEADDLFVNVTFPKGWRKRSTDHDMWTDIVDESEKKRGSIFYKAAFYDRSAFANLD